MANLEEDNSPTELYTLGEYERDLSEIKALMDKKPPSDLDLRNYGGGYLERLSMLL